MSNKYDARTRLSSSPYPPETDDSSLLLHQIVHRSSSSPFIVDPPLQPTWAPSPLIISSGSGPRVMYQANSAPGLYFPHVSSSLGMLDNDLQCDCQSEEGGFEGLVEEAPTKIAPSRNPAKRSRAAEVHNLSEKRRRSRINEKMKALQKLIPNSNKTDKASMLDEAIEYLKQLQLQVQMLTMRNGPSLYPLYLPGESHPVQFSQLNMGLLEGTGPLNIDFTDALTKSPNHISRTAHIHGPNISNVSQYGTSLGHGSSEQAPIIPTQVADIYRDDVLPSDDQGADHFQTNVLGRNN